MSSGFLKRSTDGAVIFWVPGATSRSSAAGCRREGRVDHVRVTRRVDWRQSEPHGSLYLTRGSQPFQKLNIYFMTYIARYIYATCMTQVRFPSLLLSFH